MPIIRHGYGDAPKRNGSTRAYRKARAAILMFADRCHICGELPTDTDPLVADHITPHADGGSHDPHNLRPAHRSCNARRGRGAPPSRER